MAWVTLTYHRYLWLVDTHGEDGNVLTRRCLGNTSVTQVMFYFFMWVVFIRVCSLCNNSLSCSVHHNLITIFTKKKRTKLQIEWKQRCKHSLLLLSRFSHVRLWDPRDDSPSGSPIPGILQARTLEWVAISFSNAWKWKVKVKSLSRVQLLATPWTAAYQAPPSMGFSRQEYWSGVPLPSPKHSLAMANSFYQYFRSRTKGWKFMKEFRSSKCMLQNIYNRNWIYFKLYCEI